MAHLLLLVAFLTLGFLSKSASEVSEGGKKQWNEAIKSESEMGASRNEEWKNNQTEGTNKNNHTKYQKRNDEASEKPMEKVAFWKTHKYEEWKRKVQEAMNFSIVTLPKEYSDSNNNMKNWKRNGGKWGGKQTSDPKSESDISLKNARRGWKDKEVKTEELDAKTEEWPNEKHKLTVNQGEKKFQQDGVLKFANENEDWQNDHKVEETDESLKLRMEQSNVPIVQDNGENKENVEEKREELKLRAYDNADTNGQWRMEEHKEENAKDSKPWQAEKDELVTKEEEPKQAEQRPEQDKKDEETLKSEATSEDWKNMQKKLDDMRLQEDVNKIDNKTEKPEGEPAKKNDKQSAEELTDLTGQNKELKIEESKESNDVLRDQENWNAKGEVQRLEKESTTSEQNQDQGREEAGEGTKQQENTKGWKWDDITKVETDFQKEMKKLQQVERQKHKDLPQETKKQMKNNADWKDKFNKYMKNEKGKLQRNTKASINQALLPQFQKLSGKSKSYLILANQRIDEGFLWLVGKDYAPLLAYLISCALLLLPLALAAYLFERMCSKLSLQKILFSKKLQAVKKMH